MLMSGNFQGDQALSIVVDMNQLFLVRLQVIHIPMYSLLRNLEVEVACHQDLGICSGLGSSIFCWFFNSQLPLDFLPLCGLLMKI